MLTIYYGEYPCMHFKHEISNAESDIRNSKAEAVGNVQRLTGSEHYILRVLQAVRNGVIRTDEVELYCFDVKIDVDVKGEFIQPWGDDLFEAAFNLRFGE
jgi:hypothetical protein